MTTLDPRGLEATEWLVLEFAHQQNRAIVGQPINARVAAEKFIRAYLDATRSAGEADRIAVVVNADRDDQDARALVLMDCEEMNDERWRELESTIDAEFGPLARQIVVIPGGLRRPEPPAEIEGRVEE